MMSQQEPAPQLHARKMRGELLSETEETTLQPWYAQQDAAESADLQPKWTMFKPTVAKKDDSGYICPVCGKGGLKADEMAQAWSPAEWGYVPTECAACWNHANTRYQQAVEATKQSSRQSQ